MSSTLIVRDGATKARAIEIVSHLDITRPMELTLKQYRKKRSLSQNALMWKWLNQAAELLGSELGYNADDMHLIFKQKFLPASARKIIEIDGELFEQLSTKDLTPKEMSEYMNAIDRFCASFGCVLPHPQDMQRNY